MFKKKFLLFFLLTIFLLSCFILIFKEKKIKKETQDFKTNNSLDYNSNIINDVSYNSEDSKGNKYKIEAKKGEIDISNTDIIFLSGVQAEISLNNSENIKIRSDFGKYNINNYNTIFSKNLIIEYSDNNVSAELLEFLFSKNLLIISKNVIFSNKKNILKADTIEIDIITKDIKILMHENKKKISIKHIN